MNLVTPALFAALPTPAAMAAAPIEQLEALVKSTGFFRNKAKSLKGASERLVDGLPRRGARRRWTTSSRCPASRARPRTWCAASASGWRTASSWTPTSTASRTGSAGRRARRPQHVETDLMALFPKSSWIELSHILIQHGRRLCVARKPRCGECPVKALCPSSAEAETLAAYFAVVGAGAATGAAAAATRRGSRGARPPRRGRSPRSRRPRAPAPPPFPTRGRRPRARPATGSPPPAGRRSQRSVPPRSRHRPQLRQVERERALAAGRRVVGLLVDRAEGRRARRRDVGVVAALVEEPAVAAHVRAPERDDVGLVAVVARAVEQERVHDVPAEPDARARLGPEAHAGEVGEGVDVVAALVDDGADGEVRARARG